jgi:hypothetical protein
MNLTDKDLELLDDYKSGALTEGERQALEKRLADDFDFRRQALLHWAVEASIPIATEQRTRDFLNDINQKLPPIPPPQNPWLRYFIVALAVALAAFAIWYFAFREAQPKLSPIVAGVFEPYPTYATTRGDDAKDKTTKAYEAYENKKYKNAAQLFNEAFNDKKDTILLYYKGISELGCGKIKDAEATLNQLNNSAIVPQAPLIFYLGLIEIEKNNTPKARYYLQKAANTEGLYKESAIKTLKKLE